MQSSFKLRIGGEEEENINSEDSDQEPAPNSPLGSVFGFFVAM